MTESIAKSTLPKATADNVISLTASDNVVSIPLGNEEITAVSYTHLDVYKRQDRYDTDGSPCRKRHLEWAATLPCRVLYLNGAAPLTENLTVILHEYTALIASSFVPEVNDKP